MAGEGKVFYRPATEMLECISLVSVPLTKVYFVASLVKLLNVGEWGVLARAVATCNTTSKTNMIYFFEIATKVAQA